MEIVVVVKIAIPVNVQNIDDSIVVIVDIVPIAHTVAVPIVELRKGSSAGLTAWVRVCWVRIGLRWTVPCGHNIVVIKGEGIVLVFDVVVVQIVGPICATNSEVPEVVWGFCAAHIGVQPVVDAVVILVEWASNIVIEVVVVINFAVDGAVLIAIRSGNLKIRRSNGRHRQRGVGIAPVDGHTVAWGVT